MAYKTRTNSAVAKLLEQMLAQPSRIWSKIEVADCMGVKPMHVPGYLAPGIAAGALFQSKDTPPQYALQAFTATGAPPATPSASPPAYVPPQMRAPRAGSEAPRMQQHEVAPPAPTLAATAAPTMPPAPPAQVAAAAEEPEQHEQQGEPVPFDACLWLDGDLDLFGVIELESGGVRLTADMVAKLRRRLAWSPVP